ncbi:MAG: type I pullulanase [Acholeplasmataceae bacterium]|nr:type I pullulanase [Acholeplasmataceae bacterium]
MKKVFFSILILPLTFFFLFFIKAETEKATKLVVHYFRYDDNYSGFNAWVWPYKPSSLEGKEHPFESTEIDEYGASFTIDLSEGYYSSSDVVGIIVKKGSGWGGMREFEGIDRYIDFSNADVVDGKIHAYIVEGDINIGVNNDDLNNNRPDYRDKILSAYFDKSNKIIVSLTKAAQKYELYENSNKVYEGINTSKNFDFSYQEVDIKKSYVLKVYFDDEQVSEKAISIQNLYDTPLFENSFTYEGDLGVIISEDEITFRLWAPISSQVELNLYQQGHPNYDDLGEKNDELTPYESYSLEKIENGAWEITLSKDYLFKYYTYTVTNGDLVSEVVDPYAYSTGANGLRGMIVDFKSLNPKNWQYNNRPNTITNLTDYIVYELHVRDLTTHQSWTGNEENRGKFLGLQETNTTYTKRGETVTTGFDHILELGVNAVQLLPIFDFGYVDEVEVFHNPYYNKIFNWGYMPYNFNTLEGSYSSNPFDGKTRIKEFKEVVQTYSENNLRIIMDVVYNHTGPSGDSNFNLIVPGYYHRLNENGTFSNGSGTGNETASERKMMQKFILDSVLFWAKEYNLSGFRFDLMALHDIETMNLISEELKKIDPTIIIYGEPWNGGDTPLPESFAAGKNNIKNLTEVGAFNDDFRDAVKGSVFQKDEPGWVQGETSQDIINKIKYGIVGGVNYPNINITKWHLDPNKTINYVSAHDNNTLFDKLRLTGVTPTKAQDLVVQANAITLTSQGIPFLHAGVEFMRSKPLSSGYDENSYESPDSVNQLRWDRKIDYLNVFNYYKALIAIRKTYPQFRINNANDILTNLTFLTTSDSANSIAFKITGNSSVGDVVVVHHANSNSSLINVDLDKEYHLLTTFEDYDLMGLETVSGSFYVPRNTTAILVEKILSKEITIATLKNEITIEKGASFNPLKNINVYNEEGYTLTSSHYYDVNVPGYYTITVLIKDLNNKKHLVTYTLHVKGNKYRVNLGGLS